MNSFYSILYGKFAGLQVDQLFSPRLLYPVIDALPFLKIGKGISNCAVGIPQIRIAKKTISYGPFSFNDGEFGQSAVTKLATASACLLGAKAVFRWIYRDQIKEWLAGKHDASRAGYAANIVLDELARRRIRQVEGEDFYNSVIKAADAMAASLLSHASRDYSAAARTALASFMLGRPVHTPSPIIKVVQGFLSELNALALDPSSVIELVRERISPDDGTFAGISREESRWDELANLADGLYEIVCKIPGKWHNIYLPYSHALGGDAGGLPIFQDKLLTESSIKPGQDSDDSLWQDAFFELVREENRTKKLLEKLSRAAKNLNFGSVGFPASDYVGYYRLYAELSPQIRKMIERARLVKNVLDENTFQESGNVDLQVAIQAIASETARNDMFTKDENLLKNESWTILVDSSLSLSGSSKQVKAISVCLAETARDIIGSGTWGMFAFSDDLYCVKDFSEPYDNQAKARIGGLTQSGLSHIPDAIRACRSLSLEHSRDRNYIILVSDGIPSGYSGIESEFASSIKELKKYGIDLAAIGVGGDSIKKSVRTARVVNEPADIVKEFMDIYFSLSS